MATPTIPALARRLKAAIVAIMLGVTACAAPSQPYLDNMRALCSTGSQNACNAVPVAQAQVNAEHAQQSREVALGILAVMGAAAAGASAGYAATHPVYVCRGWGCW